jgi:threonylcarbamoyladenosine tRNA methylthiotransferase MtaB
VFTYSERPDTPAALMIGKVQNRIRDERSRILHSISERLKHDFYQSQVGQKRTVIFETHKSDGFMTGFTDNYVEIKTKFVQEFLHQAGKVHLVGPVNNGCITSILISKKPID